MGQRGGAPAEGAPPATEGTWRSSHQGFSACHRGSVAGLPPRVPRLPPRLLWRSSLRGCPAIATPKALIYVHNSRLPDSLTLSSCSTHDLSRRSRLKACLEAPYSFAALAPESCNQGTTPRAKSLSRQGGQLREFPRDRHSPRASSAVAGSRHTPHQGANTHPPRVEHDRVFAQACTRVFMQAHTQGSCWDPDTRYCRSDRVSAETAHELGH